MSATEISRSIAPREPAARRIVGYLRRHPSVALAALALLIVLGWCLAPEWFTAQSPVEGVTADKLQPPSWRHPFGTDQLGRDLYARVVHGAALSLQAAALAIAIALLIGTAVGLIGGFFGGWTDRLTMRFTDVMLSIPPVLLSLIIISALGFGTTNVAIAVGVTSIANFARVMRAEVLRVRTQPYVEAARLVGGSWRRVLLRHVLPGAAGPVLSLAALDFGLVVLAVSSLSFLGFGPPPPAPEWGALVAGGRNWLATAWWLTTMPGLTVAAVVLATNRLSRIGEAERSGA